MSAEIWAGLAFFVLVMAAVTVAGYIYLLRAANRGATQLPAGLSPEPSLPPGRAAFMDMFRSLGENIPAAKAETNPYRARLALAGYRWPSAVPVFYGIKCASAMFLAGALDVFTLFYQGDLSSTLVPMICGAGVGYMLPDRVLSSRVKARARRLRSGIPAALDLMTMGIEAGQSLDQSVADVSRGLRSTHADLSAEFAQLYFELRASSSRASALRNLATRNNEPELRKLANLLIDSDRFGTSLGPALRGHVKYLRMRFRQQAQEAARKVGVKLIFPVFFLIFPSVLLVTLGPACIMMYQQLNNLLK
jgi:tight adherence protein C